MVNLNKNRKNNKEIYHTDSIMKMKLNDPEARKLFLSGNKILHDLESSDLFMLHREDNNAISGEKNRINFTFQYPQFDSSEIIIGPVLGHGGFGIVNEVQDIVLSNGDNTATTTNVNHVLHPVVAHKDDTTDSENDNNSHNDIRHKLVEKGLDYFDCNLARSYVAANVRRRMDTPSHLLLNRGNNINNNERIESAITLSKSSTANTATAARYAIKRLKPDLTELNLVRGGIDLAIEVKLLSRLHHPNIVKMRGYSKSPLLDPHFFIVMDRLYEILNHRILEWKAKLQNNSTSLWQSLLFPHRRRSINNNTNHSITSTGNKDKNKQERELVVHDVMLQRLIVAYDLASAFAYMHANSVVYRDIKQENIGFDIRGDAKIFDFGLSKGTSSSMKARDEKTGAIEYGYNLTPRTGSIPYMAPEVMAGRPYDGQCDVFSFAILMWEIFNLRQAFPSMDRHEYIERVVRNGERLSFPIFRSGLIPTSMKVLIHDAWDNVPNRRPLMKIVAKRIRQELNQMSNGDDKILRRSIHMNNRSNHSFRIEVQKQRSNHSLLQRSPSSNLRGTSHGSVSTSKIVQHYNGPSLRNGIEA